MKRQVIAVVFAVLVASCGSAFNPSAPSILSTAPAVGGGGRVSTLAVNSCPDGSAPLFSVGVVGHVATFTWAPETNIENLYADIQRMDVTNVLMPAAAFVELDARGRHELSLPAGTYYARVRIRSCRTHYSPWGGVVIFSIDGGAEPEPDVADVPEVAPGPDEGGDPIDPTCHPPEGYEYCPDGRRGR